MGFFKKSTPGYVDFTKKDSKKGVVSSVEKQNPSFNTPSFETGSSTNADTGFSFFSGQTQSSEPDNYPSQESSDDKKRKLAKRLVDMTQRIESLEKEVYDLKNRLELLERKDRL